MEPAVAIPSLSALIENVLTTGQTLAAAYEQLKSAYIIYHVNLALLTAFAEVAATKKKAYDDFVAEIGTANLIPLPSLAAQKTALFNDAMAAKNEYDSFVLTKLTPSLLAYNAAVTTYNTANAAAKAAVAALQAAMAAAIGQNGQVGSADEAALDDSLEVITDASEFSDPGVPDLGGDASDAPVP